tara:strand:+ start:361 stop:525 length:165 start_codon:yes stop_codon:yes gene_type:complete
MFLFKLENQKPQKEVRENFNLKKRKLLRDWQRFLKNGWNIATRHYHVIVFERGS